MTVNSERRFFICTWFECLKWIAEGSHTIDLFSYYFDSESKGNESACLLGFDYGKKKKKAKRTKNSSVYYATSFQNLRWANPVQHTSLSTLLHLTPIPESRYCLHLSHKGTEHILCLGLWSYGWFPMELSTFHRKIVSQGPVSSYLQILFWLPHIWPFILLISQSSHGLHLYIWQRSQPLWTLAPC